MDFDPMSPEEERELIEFLDREEQDRKQKVADLVALSSLKASLVQADAIFINLKDGSRLAVPSSLEKQVLDCLASHIQIAQDGLIEVLGK